MHKLSGGISAIALTVKRVVATMDARIGLEKRFVLLSFALLIAGSLTYWTLAAHHTNVPALLALTLLVGVVGSGISHYALFKPLRQLAIMARAVGSHDYSKRLHFSRSDEFGGLATAMDAMCDQLEAAQVASEAHIAALDQLRHSDRIATLGRLASSVAHELGNPLNVIELRAQMIAAGDTATLDQARHSAVVIVEQARRMTTIINEILSFARMQPAKVAQLDLVPVLRKGIVLSQHVSKKHNTRIEFNPPATPIEIDGDADKLLQIIVNLVVNGVQAMPKGGVLRVDIENERCAPIDDPLGSARDYVCVAVTDHGVGIPETQLARVFEPFFSTKSSEGGTGLGLSVAQGIAREHAGWISVESAVGVGSAFRIHLPKDRSHEDSGSIGQNKPNNHAALVAS